LAARQKIRGEIEKLRRGLIAGFDGFDIEAELHAEYTQLGVEGPSLRKGTLTPWTVPLRAARRSAIRAEQRGSQGLLTAAFAWSR
jgi:hypothetical protein